MAQGWESNTYQEGHVVADDMRAIESNFATLKSNFSGTAGPVAEDGQLWKDTDNDVLKVQIDSGWKGLMHGDANTPIWMYVDVAPTGWVLYAGLSDVVLAIKGGSQYPTGGAQGGSWSLPSHILAVNELPSHNHGGDTGDDTHNHTFGGATPRYGTTGVDGSYGNKLGGANSSSASVTINSDSHSHTIPSQGGGLGHDHGTAFRPLAAVGILVVLNM